MATLPRLRPRNFYDIVVEVALAANIALDMAVLKPRGTIASVSSRVAWKARSARPERCWPASSRCPLLGLWR